MPKTDNILAAFWEQKFQKEETSWGFEPSDSALNALDFFIKNGIKDILIPGIGYGRNANIFLSHGFKVTGIEISQNAIDLARSINKLDISIFHESVTEMPFDNHLYQGIFCYSLVHLLNKPQRSKFIEDCYNQLRRGGYMIFTVISTESPIFGTGILQSKNRYKIRNGLNVFFYDRESIKKEFGKFGLVSIKPIDEPIKHMKNELPLKCFYIVCKRK